MSEKFNEKINQKNINKSDFWARSKSDGFYFHICEGTGDNLLQEDINDGYVDYIYYSYFKNLTDIHDDNEYDGGMVLLKEYYQDMPLEKIIAAVENLEDVELDVLE